MADGYIVRRGGGGVKAYAAIQVQYTPGVEVSVTDGKKTFRPPDNTVGLWVCAVPYAANWTVAGDKTKVVNITKEGQIVTVNLTTLILYSPGDEHTAVTGGWTVYQNATISRESEYLQITPTMQYSGNQALVFCSNMIDLTDINVLYAEAKNNCSANNYLEFGVWDSQLEQKAVTMWAANQKTTKSLNVASLTGTYYVGFAVYWGDAVKGSGLVYNVWGERT